MAEVQCFQHVHAGQIQCGQICCKACTRQVEHLQGREPAVKGEDGQDRTASAVTWQHLPSQVDARDAACGCITINALPGIWAWICGIECSCMYNNTRTFALVR